MRWRDSKGSPGTLSREGGVIAPCWGSRVTLLLLVLSVPCWAQEAQDVGSVPVPSEEGSGLSEIPWRHSYSEGIREASAEKKPVFLDFYASWCGPCKMMDAQTFTDPGVIGKMKDFIPIKIDTDQDIDTAFEYRVSGIPRYIILNIHREVIADQAGFIPSELFMQFLENALKVGYKESDGTILTADGSLGTPKGPAPMEITGETTRVKLFELLQNPDPDLRNRATDELVRRKSDELMKALADSLRDPYLGMRIAAWKALSKMDGEMKVDFDPWAIEDVRDSAADGVASKIK